MMSAVSRAHLSISKTTEKIMPARLFDSAPPRASELAAAPSAAPARPASEDSGQRSRAIIPGDDPGDQHRPNLHLYFPAIRCRSDLPKIARFRERRYFAGLKACRTAARP